MQGHSGEMEWSPWAGIPPPHDSSWQLRGLCGNYGVYNHLKYAEAFLQDEESTDEHSINVRHSAHFWISLLYNY